VPVLGGESLNLLGQSTVQHLEAAGGVGAAVVPAPALVDDVASSGCQDRLLDPFPSIPTANGQGFASTRTVEIWGRMRPSSNMLTVCARTPASRPAVPE